MANLQVKDGAGVAKYIKATGVGSDVDPHITEQLISAAALPLPTGAATAANQVTTNGHLDGVEGLLTTIDADTGALAGAVAGSEMQVDVVGALPAGTATIGAAMDAGPSVAGTPTYTTSADMSTAADIGPAPTGGQKSVLLQAVISSAVALEFTLQMETTPGAERVSFFLPANGIVIFVPRYPIKLGTADKKWQGKASIAGNVRIHTTVRSEA